VSMYMN